MSRKQQTEHVIMLYRGLIVLIGFLLATHAVAVVIDYCGG